MKPPSSLIDTHNYRHAISELCVARDGGACGTRESAVTHVGHADTAEGPPSFRAPQLVCSVTVRYAVVFSRVTRYVALSTARAGGLSGHFGYELPRPQQSTHGRRRRRFRHARSSAGCHLATLCHLRLPIVLSGSQVFFGRSEIVEETVMLPS